MGTNLRADEGMMDQTTVTYEQFHFDQDRFALLLRSPFEENTSTGWCHSMSDDPEHVAWRVTDQKCIQVLRAKTRTPLMFSLESIRPVESGPEGEWQVSQWESGEGYSVSSRLAVSYGPFLWQRQMNDWLPVYGLELIDKLSYVLGEAHFTDMEAGCFEDAIGRLAWLEAICMRVNRKVEAASKRMWFWLDKRCRSELETAGTDPVGPLEQPKIFRLMATRTRSRQEQ